MPKLPGHDAYGATDLSCRPYLSFPGGPANDFILDKFNRGTVTRDVVHRGLIPEAIIPVAATVVAITIVWS